jgi:hypothetical protein
LEAAALPPSPSEESPVERHQEDPSSTAVAALLGLAENQSMFSPPSAEPSVSQVAPPVFETTKKNARQSFCKRLRETEGEEEQLKKYDRQDESQAKKKHKSFGKGLQQTQGTGQQTFTSYPPMGPMVGMAMGLGGMGMSMQVPFSFSHTQQGWGGSHLAFMAVPQPGGTQVLVPVNMTPGKMYF